MSPLRSPRVLIISARPRKKDRIYQTELVNVIASAVLTAGAEGIFIEEEDAGGLAMEYLPPVVRLLPPGSVTRPLDLGEVRRQFEDNRFDAAFLVGYQGTDRLRTDLSLTLNGRPTRGIGLLAEAFAALGVPVVACFGEPEDLEEAQAWIPGVLTLPLRESVEDVRAALRDLTIRAMASREEERVRLQPPFDFELRFSKPLAFATRPLLWDVTVEEHCMKWSTYDYLYGWKVLWTILMQQ